MWLVFRDEGMSLRHYLYTEREAEGFVLHGQSDFWRDMRLDSKGPEVSKKLLPGRKAMEVCVRRVRGYDFGRRTV